MAAKISATCIRVQFYVLAVTVGKCGAFTGAYAFEDVRSPRTARPSFPILISSKFTPNSQIIDAFGGPTTAKGNLGPFFIGSGLDVLSG